jgi:gamma-tubulin complex component 2
VLLAGKCLNVVRECGGVDVSKEVKDVPKTFDDVRFLDNVNGAYAHANSSLLELLLTTHALPARLRSLKHYFFLDRSDFFSYFLELSALSSKASQECECRETSVTARSCAKATKERCCSGPFQEDVKVQMNEVSLTEMVDADGQRLRHRPRCP